MSECVKFMLHLIEQINFATCYVLEKEIWSASLSPKSVGGVTARGKKLKSSNLTASPPSALAAWNVASRNANPQLTERARMIKLDYKYITRGRNKFLDKRSMSQQRGHKKGIKWSRR